MRRQPTPSPPTTAAVVIDSPQPGANVACRRPPGGSDAARDQGRRPGEVHSGPSGRTASSSRWQKRRVRSKRRNGQPQNLTADWPAFKAPADRSEPVPSACRRQSKCTCSTANECSDRAQKAYRGHGRPPRIRLREQHDWLSGTKRSSMSSRDRSRRWRSRCRTARSTSTPCHGHRSGSTATRWARHRSETSRLPQASTKSCSVIPSSVSGAREPSFERMAQPA